MSPLRRSARAVKVTVSVLFLTITVLFAANCGRTSGDADSFASASPKTVTGGTLNPLTIPKFLTSLFIPPVMKNTGTPNRYAIAVRQFKQQILPTGFPATTVWSYGPAADTPPSVAPVPAATSQFNYPAFTIEARNGPDDRSGVPITVDWINDLRDPTTGNFLPHLFAIDQTLHWANPAKDCIDNTRRTDCRGKSALPYSGPVPIVTHVHGAHVTPESDGFPEAWWLPNANNIPAGYATTGRLVNQFGTATNSPGIGRFTYRNDQPSTTLWYHDHTLGMTRSNVYAGPVGFWLIRQTDGGEDGLTSGILPAPAPRANEDPNFDIITRAKIREIPIVIQDRSFNDDGSLFYPANRAFFEGLGTGQVASTPGNIAAGLNIPFLPSDRSDIPPIWNPEAFFNVIVVNGASWPKLEVAPALYRFRVLDACNSRFLNLSLFQVNPGQNTITASEVPFFQLGAEQSLLPQVVMIQTGYATPLSPNVPIPTKTSQMRPAAHKDQALLLGPAERADVIVDFRGLPHGTRVRMINTGPDSPFGGFPVIPADARTTGQVMEFVVNSALNGESPTDPVLSNGLSNPNAATSPNQLVLNQGGVDQVQTYPASAGGTSLTRDQALLEEESRKVCARISPNGTISYVELSSTDEFDPLDSNNACFAARGVPFAPKAALLGKNGSAGAPGPGGAGAQPTMWSDPIATKPQLNANEAWELWNSTEDAHPIHLHLVKFKVIARRGVNGTPSRVPGNGVQPWESGWKDTIIAYPGEVTTLAAKFDIPGLYVWHCHIIEHEDNEMMAPYCVGDGPGCNLSR